MWEFKKHQAYKFVLLWIHFCHIFHYFFVESISLYFKAKTVLKWHIRKVVPQTQDFWWNPKLETWDPYCE